MDVSPADWHCVSCPFVCLFAVCVCVCRFISIFLHHVFSSPMLNMKKLLVIASLLIRSRMADDERRFDTLNVVAGIDDAMLGGVLSLSGWVRICSTFLMKCNVFTISRAFFHIYVVGQ